MTRRIAAAVLLVCASLLAIAGTRTVRADDGAPPVITNVSPLTVNAGTAVRVAIMGSGLASAAAVVLDPPITGDSFLAFNDTTLLLSLPATTPAGAYTLRVITPNGAAQSQISFTVLAAPPTEGPAQPGGVTAGPVPSLLPAPVAADPTPSSVGAEPPAADPRPVPATVAAAQVVTDSPFFALAVGIAVGAFLYVLWGREGRLRVARRRGFFAQLVARPVQRLGLGRICLQCGRLHYVLRTRRDLWRAGQFCSATCFVASQEEELELESSNDVAPSRLRGVGVYADMEKSLQAALRAEATAMGALLFSVDNALNVQLVPDAQRPPGGGPAEPGAAFGAPATAGAAPAERRSVPAQD